jgi:hypothetical protein
MTPMSPAGIAHVERANDKGFSIVPLSEDKADCDKRTSMKAWESAFNEY